MTLKERFFSQFRSGVLPHIFEFSKLLTAAKADVFVMMARKAACFIDCLEELGLVALDGLVTTDRLLDMDTSWLKNKKVCLIDDALISGTTLYQTRKKLIESGAKSVDIKVLCVNKDYWSRDLITVEPPYLSLDDEQTAALCSSIVESISLLPYPYAVDFPIFRNLRVPLRDLEELITLQNWESYDVTSSLQRKHNILSLTLKPTKAVLSELNREIGWELQEGGHIFKVRLYGHLLDAKRKVYLFRTMPLVAFDPLTTAQINILWTNLIGNHSHEKTFFEAFTTIESRLRFIQYLAAARMGRLFINSVKRHINTAVEVQHDLRAVGYLFPPQHSLSVVNVCNSNKPVFSGKPKVTSADVPVSSQISTSKLTDNSLPYVQSKLTQPFLNFYNEKELKARRLVLDLGKAVFSNADHRQIMNRLGTGISLPELRATIAAAKSEVDISKAVSLFIDSAIDRGIVVPITAKVGNVVFRAYRHGEDVKFSESEARLFCIALQNFLKSSGRAAAPHLMTEKLFVLLIRIGLHKQFLTRWMGTLGEDGTVGVRYALKGAVVQSESSKIYKYNAQNVLTTMLVDFGFLNKAEGKDNYQVAAIPDAPLKEGAEQEAIVIGSLFGTLLSVGGKTRLTNDELTLIATCLYPNDLAGALAAEIDIFSRFWTWNSRKIYDRFFDGKSRSGAGKLDDCKKMLQTLRSPKLYFFEAINSGWWKFRSFMQEIPWKIIERVAKEFDDNPVYQATWRSFWSTNARQKATAFPPELKRIIYRQGSWCLRANIYVRVVELVLLGELVQFALNEEEKTAFENSVSKTQSEINRLREDLKTYEKTALKEIERLLAIFPIDAEKAARIALNGLRSLGGEAKSILDVIDTTITAFGKPKSFTRYSHALYIDLKPYAGNKGVWDKAYKIVEEYGIRAKKESGDSKTRLHGVPPGQCGFNKGYWVCATGNFGRTWLIRLAKRLLKDLSIEAQVKTLLVANLQEDWQLLRSEANSEYTGRRFWQLAHTLVEHKFFADGGDAFCLAIPTNKGDLKNIQDEICSGDLPLHQTDETDHLTAGEPTTLAFTVKNLPYLRPAATQENQKPLRKADIGIITIITEETQAVKEHLEIYPNFMTVKGKKNQAIYYEGTLPRATGGETYKVVCTQQLTQGNRSVMPAYQRLMKEYNPRLIVLLGIGGSIHEDSKCGDVVLAEQIIYYDKRAVTDEGAKRRAEAYRVPAWLVSYINNFFVELKDGALPSKTLLPRAGFKLHFGPLGTGEAVVKYREAGERKFLTEFNEKTLVLETEAGGFSQSFYEDELSNEEKPVGYLIVRGISDHADEDKDDQWKKVASENAVVALAELVKSVSALTDTFGE